jgi:SAM-dependent methyltransferase
MHETINNYLFWIGTFFLTWYAYILIFHRGVPNIGTAPAIQKKIAEIVKEHYEQSGKKDYLVIDLGSGEGGLTRSLARALPGARVIGIEFTPQSFATANFWKRHFKLDNLEYIKGDFFDYDFAQADAIVFYQSIYYMERLGQKLNKEAKKGTLVVSNKFTLGDGWKPEATVNVKTLYLHQRKVNVYRKL